MLEPTTFPIAISALPLSADMRLTAVVAPITITQSTIRREIPLMLLSFLVLFFLSYDTIFAGTGATENILSRGEGLTLLGFFLIFLTYTFAIAKDSPNDPHADNTPLKPYPSGSSLSSSSVGSLHWSMVVTSSSPQHQALHAPSA